MNKIRLDQLLVQKKLTESREKAQRLIRSGLVFVNNQVETKPGHQFDTKSLILVKENKLYVSRGALKLKEGHKNFKFKIKNKVCMDIGSSTGGFTDYMLKNNAKKIYAIDCGTNQLHWKIRNDERVIVREKTNARYLKAGDFKEKINLCTIDVSFISLKKIIPVIHPLLDDNGQIISLIKPQFEAGKEFVEKGGVITNPNIHTKVIEEIKEFGCKEIGLTWIDICESPIEGPAGNKEFLAFWNK